MSIETLIQNLINAVEANTAALGGAAASTGETNTAAAAADTKPATKPAAKPAAKKGPSREEMVAVLTEVKEKLGTDAGKALVKLSGVEKMAAIPDDKIKVVYDAAVKKLAAPAEEEAAEDDGL